MKDIYGKEVLAALAEIYPQLYLVPGDAGAEAYKSVAYRGSAPNCKTLSHFSGDDRDSCAMETTPVGEITVVTLNVRADFETFLNIMANRCVPRVIPATQGAAIIDGVVNWNRINAHREEYFRSELASGRFPDWNSEFKRFTADKSNYLDALIALSVGPYSGIPARRLDLGDAEWLDLSHRIRRAHECTHFICRRKYPELVDAVWDEVVADAVGILAALGRFDMGMEEAFLGIDGGKYVGGRLENYVEADQLDAAAAKIHGLLGKIAEFALEHAGAQPFGFAVMLEEQKAEWWP